jgi:hypothetical protein
MSDKDIQFIKEQASALKLNMSESGFKAELTKLQDKFKATQQKINTSQPDNLSDEEAYQEYLKINNQK